MYHMLTLYFEEEDDKLEILIEGWVSIKKD